MNLFETEIRNLLKKHTQAEISLEKPAQPEFGDYAFPCFLLAKEMKKSPALIAKDIAAKIKPSKLVQKAEAKGPYVNFFVKKDALAEDVLAKIAKEKDSYGSAKHKEKIMIEYVAPNTNKPLHLGHVRNLLLGESLAKIYEFLGCKVIRVNLNNDRGVHICKAMLAYKLWGSSREPDKKTDHFVGDFYVMYSKKEKENPELENEIQAMLKLWEKGDRETIALWKKMNKWAIDGFSETYKTFGVKFDKIYKESEHYLAAKDIVLDGLKRGIFEKDDDGNVVARLEKYGLPDKVLLRADGTSIYMTQDINLAKIKYDDYKMDRSIYVVGSEQILHFRQLFRILEMLGFGHTESLFHLSYGMVYLPEGKMKSREGTVVDADNLVEEVVGLAGNEINKRHSDLDEKEIEKRAKQIGMGALTFFILKYDPIKDFTYHPEESISFEGETGPYVQYAHARICSIMRKFEGKISGDADLSLLKTEHEANLVSHLGDFPAVVEEAAGHYRPNAIARYLLELSQMFNEFYHACPILKEEEKLRDARLLLTDCVRQVLKNGLLLLSIDAPEEM